MFESLMMEYQSGKQSDWLKAKNSNNTISNFTQLCHVFIKIKPDFVPVPYLWKLKKLETNVLTTESRKSTVIKLLVVLEQSFWIFRKNFSFWQTKFEPLMMEYQSGKWSNYLKDKKNLSIQFQILHNSVVFLFKLNLTL